MRLHPFERGRLALVALRLWQQRLCARAAGTDQAGRGLFEVGERVALRILRLPGGGKRGKLGAPAVEFRFGAVELHAQLLQSLPDLSGFGDEPCTFGRQHFVLGAAGSHGLLQGFELRLQCRQPGLMTADVVFQRVMLHTQRVQPALQLVDFRRQRLACVGQGLQLRMPCVRLLLQALDPGFEQRLQGLQALQFGIERFMPGTQAVQLLAVPVDFGGQRPAFGLQCIPLVRDGGGFLPQGFEFRCQHRQQGLQALDVVLQLARTPGQGVLLPVQVFGFLQQRVACGTQRRESGLDLPA
ncbi:MAG TPA: hypothetical protein PK403_09315, partial [Plasticicumulans sp.]|nr:hypothetical protein [Plasticicumulans sp.]